MASRNKNEELDDCIRNVSNETYRILAQCGNLNNVSRQQLEKAHLHSASSPLAIRRFSFDSHVLFGGKPKAKVTRRASCSPGLLPIYRNQDVLGSGSSSQVLARRRHSDVGIMSGVTSNWRLKESHKFQKRRNSMASLSTSKQLASGTSVLWEGDGNTDICTEGLQIVHEVKSNHDTPVTLTPRTSLSKDSTEFLLSESNLLRNQDSCESSIENPTKCDENDSEGNLFPVPGHANKAVEELTSCLESKDIRHKIVTEEQNRYPPSEEFVSGIHTERHSVERMLPKSMSFMSVIETKCELQQKKTKSVSLGQLSSRRQRRKAISYNTEDRPSFNPNSSDLLQRSCEESSGENMKANERPSQASVEKTNSLLKETVETNYHDHQDNGLYWMPENHSLLPSDHQFFFRGLKFCKV